MRKDYTSQVSRSLPGCSDAGIMVLTASSWKVRKPNGWDPLLETREFREELEKRRQFSVFIVSSFQM